MPQVAGQAWRAYVAAHTVLAQGLSHTVRKTDA